MGRRKRKNIYIKDPEVQKKIEDLRKLFPGMTYDELFKAHLKVPTPDMVLGDRFFEIAGLLLQRYKDPKIMNLATVLWVLELNSAKGNFDIDRILYDLEKSIALKIYHKKKLHSSFMNGPIIEA